MSIRIKKTTNLQDINLKNEPFKIWGKMVPSLRNGKWDYQIEKFKESYIDRFPDENYEYDPQNIYIAAYDNDILIGLAILCQDMFKYLYLDDLKIASRYRGQGIGSRLISACLKEAKRLNMQGIFTIAQDNNLSACLFYLKNHFEIGGFNNYNYRGTSQENKADIYFYKDC